MNCFYSGDIGRLILSLPPFLVFPASLVSIKGSLDQKYILCRGGNREGTSTFITIISFESYKLYKINDIIVVTSVEKTK